MVFHSILFYSILFYSILFYSILFYSILFYSILFYSILFYSILIFSILFYSILFYSILFYSILFYSIQFYSILFYSILFYSIPYYTIQVKKCTTGPGRCYIQRFYLSTSIFFSTCVYQPTRICHIYYLLFYSLLLHNASLHCADTIATSYCGILESKHEHNKGLPCA